MTIMMVGGGYSDDGSSDADGDGLLDADELAGYEILKPYESSFYDESTGEEVTYLEYYPEWIYTDPTLKDTDGDLIEDLIELQLYMDPTDPSDGDVDGDDDSLSLGREMQLGTSDSEPDHDFDLIDDGIEVLILGTDPLDPNDPPPPPEEEPEAVGESTEDTSTPQTLPESDPEPAPDDPDDPGNPTTAEAGVVTLTPFELWLRVHGVSSAIAAESDTPIDPDDPDADGLSNTLEFELGTHPMRPDTDGDGINDGREYHGEWTVTLAAGEPVMTEVEVEYYDEYSGETYTWTEWVEEVLESTSIFRSSDPTLRNTDGDRWSDLEEWTYHTDPRNPLDPGSDDAAESAGSLPSWFTAHHPGISDYGDEDSDGIDNLTEWQRGTDLFSGDTDRDGISDRDEINGIYIEGEPSGYWEEYTYYDYDYETGEAFEVIERYFMEDGFSSGEWVYTDPTQADSDGDGIGDLLERALGYDPNDAYDTAFVDLDQDGLFLADELALGTSDTEPNGDLDGDGISDFAELKQISPLMEALGFPPFDPLDRSDGLADFDYDGLSNAEEFVLDTDRLDPDSDNDGADDLTEIDAGTDPNDPTDVPALEDLDPEEGDGSSHDDTVGSTDENTSGSPNSGGPGGTSSSEDGDVGSTGGDTGGDGSTHDDPPEEEEATETGEYGYYFQVKTQKASVSAPSIVDNSNETYGGPAEDGQDEEGGQGDSQDGQDEQEEQDDYPPMTSDDGYAASGGGSRYNETNDSREVLEEIQGLKNGTVAEGFAPETVRLFLNGVTVPSNGEWLDSAYTTGLAPVNRVVPRNEQRPFAAESSVTYKERESLTDIEGREQVAKASWSGASSAHVIRLIRKQAINSTDPVGLEKEVKFTFLKVTSVRDTSLSSTQPDPVVESVEVVEFTIPSEKGVSNGVNVETPVTTGKLRTVRLLPVDLKVDYDRDGEDDILGDAGDYATDDKPYRFWINNDNDTGDGPAAEDEETGNDSSDGTIDCLRDLEDFTRLHLDVSSVSDMIDNDLIEIGLKFIDKKSGNPSIRVFLAADETSGSDDFLFDETEAAKQQGGKYGSELIKVSSGDAWLPKTAFDSASAGGHLHLVFEGVTEGEANLALLVKPKNGSTAEASMVPMKLQKVRNMYEHHTAGDTITAAVGSIPLNPTKTTDSGTYGPDSPEEEEAIVFIHGWRMQLWERRYFADTSYKRLWHQGYAGRFYHFSWPTEWCARRASWPYDPLDPDNYADSEEKAYVSGARTLFGFLTTLESKYPGEVRMFAHSMGGIVASEALRSGAPIHTYAACQTAMAAHAYEAPPSASDRGVTSYNLGVWDSPEVYADYPPTGLPYYESIVANIFNFHNELDDALDGWTKGQDFKPNNGGGISPDENYHCDDFDEAANTGLFNFDEGILHPQRDLHFPGDRFEIFAHCAEARSIALGAGPVNTVRDNFDIRRDFSDPARFGFGATPAGHSGQFRATNMIRHEFWKIMLSNRCFGSTVKRKESTNP